MTLIQPDIITEGTAYDFVVSEEYDGLRLDKAVTGMAEALWSRTFIQKLISEQNVYLNGKVKKAGTSVSEGDIIRVCAPELKPLEIEAEDIPLDVLYEDDDVIVVNKPKGMVVHPAAGHVTGTLVNALLYHCKGSLSGINGVLRPGIVHRIDKDTSGSIIACKNDRAHMAIAAQLKEHSLNRTYRAIAVGVPQLSEFTIDKPIGRHPTDRKRMAVVNGGKSAITHVEILKELEGAVYIECRLHTGRTHQIRVHMESEGYPLLGDQVYYRGRQPIPAMKNIVTDGQALHAYELGFIHPVSGEYIETIAPEPDYFSKIVGKFALN